jgi:hypothetical protein
MSAAEPPSAFPSAVSLGSIDAQKPTYRQLTPSCMLRSRNGPEIFVARSGPFIRFNRANRNLVLPCQMLEVCLQCPEGSCRSNTGLTTRIHQPTDSGRLGRVPRRGDVKPPPPSDQQEISRDQGRVVRDHGHQVELVDFHQRVGVG